MCDTMWRHLVKATEVTAGLAESNGSLPPGGSPAGWLPVHLDQLRAQRSVTSVGKLYLLLPKVDLRPKQCGDRSIRFSVCPSVCLHFMAMVTT